MEFFNMIWNAISTPNETLINIFLVFAIFFVEAPLTFSAITSIFKIEYTRKQKYFYILSTSLVSLLSMFILNNPYNVVFNYVFNFIIIYLIFHINKFKNLLATIFPSIIFNLLMALFLNPYLTLLNITYEQVNNIPLYRIPLVLFIDFLFFIFVMLLKSKKFTIKIFDNFDKKNKAIITANFIFGLLNIVIQSILTMNYIDILPIGFTFFNFICLLTYFCLSFYSLAKIMKLVTTTQKLESAEEYNKTLHILHDSVRGFKHDFDNIVTTIGGYVKTNDMAGLKKYYSQLEEDCQKVNNLYLLNPDIINNPGIYNLLTAKYNEAIEKNIKVNITFLLDLNNLHMKIYEFTRMLGILLDNAIEAASECDKKVLNISFRNDSKNNVNIIQIENTYLDKNVDIDHIFNKGITGKENHTGLGLWEVREILKKNNNINLQTTKTDEYFSQQLEIYY